MMDRFLGKVAVVTGASSGIGEAVCKEFVKRGLTVVGLARRVDKLRALEEFLAAHKDVYPGQFSFIKCDLTNEEEIRDAFAQIKERLGVIQLLVNNAGILLKTSLSAVTGEYYDKVFDTNVKALLLCSKEAIQSMNDNSSPGHIVNINSVSGLSLRNFNVLNKGTIYAASKHTSKVFAEALRRELSYERKHIKITNIYPGVVETDMTAEFMKVRGLNEYEYLVVEDITAAIVYVLETPPRVLISDMTIKSIFEH